VKKSAKTTSIAIVGTLLFCVPLLLCFPSVQRLVCLEILSHYFDDARAKEINVGFSGMRAKDVCIRNHDFTVKCANLDMKWSLKDSSLRKIFTVESATLDKVMLSIENEPKDVLYFEKKKVKNDLDPDFVDVISKIFEQLKQHTSPRKLPIAINNLSVNGSFDAYERILGEFSLSVANFMQSKTTDIDFALDTDFEQQLAGKFKIAGHLTVNRDAVGVIDSATLNSSIISKIGSEKHAKTFLLDITYDKSKQAGDLLHATFADEQTAERLFDMSCSFDESTKNISFQTNIQVPNSREVDANFGQFSFQTFFAGEYDMDSSKGLIKSNFEATIPRGFFGRTLPELKSDLQLRIVSSIGVLGEFAELQSISGELRDANKEQVNCSIELMDKHRIGWKGSNFWRDLNGLVLNVNVNGIDTSIFGPVRSGWHLLSVAKGKCILTVKNNQLNIRGDAEKFYLSPLHVTLNGIKIFDEFECSFEPRVVIGNVLKCDIVGLACMDDSGASVLQGDLGFAIDRKSRSCSGCLVCALPNLLNQPIFSNEMKPTSGFATCSFNLIQDWHTNICNGDVEFKLKAISYAGSKFPLNGNLDINFASTSSEENEFKFNIESRLHDTMDSDVSVNGVVSNNIQMPDNGTRIDVKSSTICLSDVITVCKLFELNLPEGSNLREDFLVGNFFLTNDVSVWDEFSFDTSVQVDALYLNNVKLCSDLSCDLQVDPKSVNLSKLICYILDAPLVASGSIAFTKDDYADTYNANMYFSLSDLSASKCMLVLNYHPKMFTGTFRVNGNFSSSQPFISDLFSRMQGKIDIVGFDGSISPMASFNNEQKGVVGIIGIASNLGNIDVVNKLMEALESIPYDNMSASIIRHDNSNITLDSFSITGNNVKMVANGTLTARRDLSFKDYSLYLKAQINTKNNMTEIFDRLGWSSNAFDFYGYKLGPKFSIRGTIRNPDLTEVRELLASTSAKLFLDLERNGQESVPIISPEILLKMFQK
jgi:hypothetical protein